MADLRSKQLKDGFQNLVTIGATTTSDPTTGALTNGKDTAITQVTLGLGSVSAPSYSFTGDTDTGMFSTGANALNLVTGSNTRMTISNSGNVSIGTASSSAKLQVGTSNEEILRLERDTTSNDSFIDLTYASGHSDDSDANHEYSKIRTKVVANLENSESSELHFQTINSGTIGNKMVITKEGNIGIGTDTPDQLLHLKGTSPFMSISHSSDNSTSGILFRRTDNDQNRGNILYDFANDAMTFRVSTNGTGESMRITSAGSVGIGETSVDAKLHLTTATAGLVNQKFESAGSAAWRLGVPASQTYFAFDNANDDLSSPKLVIDTNGKVGIGTSSPAATLQIEGDLDVRTASNKNLHIRSFPSFDNFSNQGVGISLSRTSSDADLMAVGVVDTDKLGLFSRSGIILATGGSNAFQHTSEVVRIDGSGNLGLGISSPDYKAHIFDDTITSSTKTLLQFDSNSIADGGGYNIDFRTSSNDTADRFVARIQGAREGSGATSQLSFFTDDGSSLNQRMLINASGNVGIGASSPSQRLEIHDASSTTTANDGGVGIVIKNTNNTDNNQASLEFLNSGGTKTASIISTFIDHSTDEGALSFAVGDGGGTFAEAMRIDANGRVGIGVTSPSLALEVSDNNTNGVLGVKNTSNDRNTFKSSNAAGTRTLDIGNNSSGHGILNIRNSSGSVQTQIQGSGDSFFTGNIGMGTSSPENNLHIAGTNTVAMTLQAPTHDSGVASTATMNFKYQSSGGSAIGKIQLVEKDTNSFNGKFVFGLPHSDSGSQSTRDIMTIDFNGDILPAVDSLSDIGSSSNRFVDIHADNGTIQTSDRNQKQDFEQITEAEAKVAQKAKGLLTKYKWIKDVQKYGDDAQYHIGIIAQELITAFEEEGLDYKKYAMIYESEHLEDSGEITKYYGVRYTELLAFIISTL